MRLPNLPLHFCSKDIFKQIGNTLGRYMDYDKSYKLTVNMSMARILVHLDTREDLEENIQLHWWDTCKV